MNAVVAKMMGQAVSNGMFTGYARANNLRLAQLYDRSMVSAMGASRQVEEAKGLNPTLDSVHTPLRPRALSFQDSAFLRDYRDNMLDIQTAASRVGSQGADNAGRYAILRQRGRTGWTIWPPCLPTPPWPKRGAAWRRPGTGTR